MFFGFDVVHCVGLGVLAIVSTYFAEVSITLERMLSYYFPILTITTLMTVAFGFLIGEPTSLIFVLLTITLILSICYVVRAVGYSACFGWSSGHLLIATLPLKAR